MYGNRINLDDVEKIIRSNGIDCACNGADDNLNIFLTSNDKKNFVKNFIAKKTGIHKKGFNVKVIDSIPRNETGKIIYSKLNSL